MCKYQHLSKPSASVYETWRRGNVARPFLFPSHALHEMALRMDVVEGKRAASTSTLRCKEMARKKSPIASMFEQEQVAYGSDHWRFRRSDLLGRSMLVFGGDPSYEKAHRKTTEVAVAASSSTSGYSTGSSPLARTQPSPRLRMHTMHRKEVGLSPRAVRVFPGGPALFLEAAPHIDERQQPLSLTDAVTAAERESPFPTGNARLLPTSLSRAAGNTQVADLERVLPVISFEAQQSFDAIAGAQERKAARRGPTHRARIAGPASSPATTTSQASDWRQLRENDEFGARVDALVEQARYGGNEVGANSSRPAFVTRFIIPSRQEEQRQAALHFSCPHPYGCVLTRGFVRVSYSESH